MSETRYYIAVVQWGSKWNSEFGYFGAGQELSETLYKQVEQFPEEFESVGRLPHFEAEGFEVYSAGKSTNRRLDGGTDYVMCGHPNYEQYEAIKRCPGWLTWKQVEDAESAR